MQGRALYSNYFIHAGIEALMEIVASTSNAENLVEIAGIGGEFNLADWRICESTAKLKSAKNKSCPGLKLVWARDRL